MNICPCCKRAIPQPKNTLDKRILQDLERVNAAIRACESALSNPFFADAIDAIKAERLRLNRALTDHRLLWSLYRRADKKPPYFVVESVEVAA